MEFGLDEDLIIIDDCTPASRRNAGCFGNTIMASDGGFVAVGNDPAGPGGSAVLTSANGRSWSLQLAIHWTKPGGMS